MDRKIWIGMILGLAVFLLSQGMGPISAATPKIAKKALILVDPGYSGYSYRVAQQIGDKLKKKKYDVNIVKAQSFKDEYLQETDLLVVGGPTYAHRPSKALQTFLSDLKVSGLDTLLFQTGGINCSGIDPLQESARMKGLVVIGQMTLMVKESNRMAEKIDKLLEPIE